MVVPVKTSEKTFQKKDQHRELWIAASVEIWRRAAADVDSTDSYFSSPAAGGMVGANVRVVAACIYSNAMVLSSIYFACYHTIHRKAGRSETLKIT